MARKNPPTYSELKSQLQESWRDLHHNATTLHLIGVWGDDERSPDEFKSWLDFFNLHSLEALSDRAKEELGQSYTFAQYGRSGATVAPVEVCDYLHSGDYDKFADVMYYADPDTGNALDTYNTARRLMRLFDWTNTQVKDYVKRLPAAWIAYCKEEEEETC